MPTSRPDALAKAEARWSAVADRFEKVYAMRLPRHVQYVAAFFFGLSDEEREAAWQMDAAGLFGVGEWFEDGALDKTAYADERTHGRFRRDPPEMVTFISGNSDGSHWGLWFDDPSELPTVCAHNWARDSAETAEGKPTLLDSVKARVDDHDDHERTPAWESTYAWLAELVTLERESHREEGIAAPPERTPWCTGGMDPVGVEPPDDFVGYDARRSRYDALREDEPEALEMILQAKAELLQGEAGRALFLGRELHWFDADETRDASTELLTGAYRALGRDALADVVEAHHASRDMQTVDAYAATSSPFHLAVLRDDVDAVARLIEDPMVEDSWIENAARQTQNPAIREVLFSKLPRAVLPALGMALYRASPRDNEAQHRAAAILREALARGATVEQTMEAAREAQDYRTWRLLRDHGLALDVERWVADARALLARAVESGVTREEVCRELLLRRMSEWAADFIDDVDVAWRGPGELTLLHTAAGSGLPEMVRRLLARGADEQARDASGRTPLEHAQMAAQRGFDGASETISLLE